VQKNFTLLEVDVFAEIIEIGLYSSCLQPQSMIIFIKRYRREKDKSPTNSHLLEKYQDLETKQEK